MNDQEFFTVHHALTINVEPLEEHFTLPSHEIFEAEIPAPFVVASEFSQLEQLSDSARMELKNSDFKSVLQLLEAQNAKLNLLLTFMLSQQDDPQSRSATTRFGASQLTYLAKSPLQIGQKVRVKLFLEYPAAAIYCYASVMQCQQEPEHTLVTLKYDLLRDVDQDLLIKAALYQQQRLLRQRSLDREKPQA
ncbi:PilZ domain-containing protein [Vibrio cholerae]|uniref:PilZ domain-containing protein n=1 Tax=Vibrio cholerae TaxID=666 RepID=UPI0008941431|nr:PilZ domain-containing protein [Vibrio cholerae]EGR0286386.1 PilZ domain-containing protein [Vibrio cholerae]EGR2534504.1 PilZ domain-containing protein [Vibrio cholerae]EGR4229667.1 PilZ domain-containing protein [Vibrio cholerae]EKF9087572.1 PilZ domain-containing protein [Vibrio cholerae]EKF9761169.1 PilZ domain-containing protein [Vibrio cholerae]